MGGNELTVIQEKEMERVILVGCQLPKVDDLSFQYTLDELKSLTKTAKGEVKAVLTQKRSSRHPATYLGKGKVEELIALEAELEADVIIINDELTPSQIRNLTNVLESRVIDRTQLILDIFAQRAKSREGKLQVELAQHKYILPRLIGKGIALSRLGGGIGTRGPGETKLETDRRHIHRRIDEIKSQLVNIVSHRERYRERRKHNQTFQLALVGYTNAGKSTLFNRLTEADAFEENQLFATLDPMTRKCVLPSGFIALLTDTVGFIQDLPTTLIAAFRSTLEEAKEADLILHVVDSSNADYFNHEQTVYNLLKELDANDIPMLTIYNKMDEVDPEFVPSSNNEFIEVSAFNPEDILLLRKKIQSLMMNNMEEYKVYLPNSEGKLLAQLKSTSVLTELSYEEEKDRYFCKGFIQPSLSITHQLRNYTQ